MTITAWAITAAWITAGVWLLGFTAGLVVDGVKDVKAAAIGYTTAFVVILGGLAAAIAALIAVAAAFVIAVN